MRKLHFLDKLWLGIQMSTSIFMVWLSLVILFRGIFFPQAAPTAQLKIFPTLSHLQVGDTGSFSIIMTTDPGDKIGGFQIFLNYNPNLVEITSIELSDQFKNWNPIANEVKNQQIKLIYFTLEDFYGVGGEVKLADINFIAKQPGIGHLIFADDSELNFKNEISAQGYQISLLDTTVPGRIFVTDSEIGGPADPTSVPTASPSNSPTPTLSPTAVPTNHPTSISSTSPAPSVIVTPPSISTTIYKPTTSNPSPSSPPPASITQKISISPQPTNIKISEQASTSSPNLLKNNLGLVKIIAAIVSITLLLILIIYFITPRNSSQRHPSRPPD